MNFDTGAGLRTWTAALLLAVIAGAVFSAGCSREVIDFPYADERYVYPEGGVDLVRVHLGSIVDLRPEDQRRGEGHFAGITYPGDESWARPVTDIYRDALARDLTQTRLVELTPLPSQATYVVEAEIESFHCRAERPAMGFVLPVLAGAVGGFALGDDTSSRLKRTALFGLVSYGAMPMPLDQSAEVVVSLTMRDRDGSVVWERTCLGEIYDRVAEPVTSRRDKLYSERYLPQAVKRANACLLGQLRQFLSSE